MFLKQFQSLVNGEKDVYTIKELLELFASSSIAVFLVLVTFITSIPLPPWGGGFETIPGGILCIFLAIQGLIGLESVYLPSFLHNIEINVGFVKESEYIRKSFDWIDENIQEDRYKWALNTFTEKLMYFLVVPNALLMMVPIVFTNGPPSQCITLMALAWLLYDGYYFMIMLGVSAFIFITYIILFIVFAKLLYRTRRTWTFGLWK